MKQHTFKLSLICACTVFLFSCKTNGQETNRDGERKRGERPSIEELFEKMDANEDGLLSRKEVKGPLKKNFKKIDVNEDGFLSKEEIEKAPKPKRERPQRRE